MVRVFLIAAAASLLAAASRPPTVDYRLSVEPQSDGRPPLLDVEMRFRGDDDGETRLDLPVGRSPTHDGWRYISDFSVRGAKATQDGPAVRVLHHRPGAKLTVRYRVQSAYDQDPPGDEGDPRLGPLVRPGWFMALGEAVFAIPEGRLAEPASFQWGPAPKDWRLASDLERGDGAASASVRDVGESLSVGGADLALVERPVAGGVLRVAGLAGGAYPPQAVADDMAKVAEAAHGFWHAQGAPGLVAVLPLAPARGASTAGGVGRADGALVYATPGRAFSLPWAAARAWTRSWIPSRLGTVASADDPASAWLVDGFTDFLTVRSVLRGGVQPVDEVVDRMAATMKAYDANPERAAPAAKVAAGYWTDANLHELPAQRGLLLALKFDEEIRAKSGGKADLNTIVRHMRDHDALFPPGQGPDVVTGLVSAAWVVAGLDLQGDIAKYVAGGAPVDLPAEMFDGCLQARITTAPAYDAGFDLEGSLAAHTVRGVRRFGPAWNSGLRDGMTLDTASYRAGDTNRQIELSVRARGRGRAAGKARAIAYWPYGDADVESRRLQLTPGMSPTALAACARKLAGL